MFRMKVLHILAVLIKKYSFFRYYANTPKYLNLKIVIIVKFILFVAYFFHYQKSANGYVTKKINSQKLLFNC